MTIETKYSLTNKVWVMRENKPMSYDIWRIQPTVKRTNDGSSDTCIMYSFEELGKLYPESELFPTKEALLQSL